MEVLNLPEIVSSLNRLREVLSQKKDDASFINEGLDLMNMIDEWFYSKKEYYHPLPFDNEISGFDRGRLLKKKYPTPEEAAASGTYGFGFIGGVHRITISPTSTTRGVIYMSLFTKNGDTLQIKSTKNLKDERKPSELESLGEYFPFSPTESAYVGVNKWGDFTVMVYVKNASGVLDKVLAYSKGWPGQIEYHIHYDEAGELHNITSSGVVTWPLK